jgi:hypothetical protein
MSLYNVLKVGAVLAVAGAAGYIGYKAIVAYKEEQEYQAKQEEINDIKTQLVLKMMSIRLIVSFNGSEWLEIKDPQAYSYYVDLVNARSTGYRGFSHADFKLLLYKLEYVYAVVTAR